MSALPAAEVEPEPIIVYRSVNGNGETFAVEPQSLRRLRATFGVGLRSHPRVFIAHDVLADRDHIQDSVAPQVVALLTGLSEERLKSLGGVIFRDPVTERDLPRVEA
jgi:hypothetical protein